MCVCKQPKNTAVCTFSRKPVATCFSVLFLISFFAPCCRSFRQVIPFSSEIRSHHHLWKQRQCNEDIKLQKVKRCWKSKIDEWNEEFLQYTRIFGGPTDCVLCHKHARQILRCKKKKMRTFCGCRSNWLFSSIKTCSFIWTEHDDFNIFLIWILTSPSSS